MPFLVQNFASLWLPMFFRVRMHWTWFPRNILDAWKYNSLSAAVDKVCIHRQEGAVEDALGLMTADDLPTRAQRNWCISIHGMAVLAYPVLP